MKEKYLKYSRFQSQLDLPFLETPEKSLVEIFNVLEIKFGLIKGSKQRFIDLGSGNGQVVIFAAKNYHITSLGIEINQELVKEAKERIKKLKKENLTQKKYIKKIKILNCDFYQTNLNRFDFIFIDSLPTMQKYLKHIFLTAKIDAIIISYKYPLENLNDIMIQKDFIEKAEGEHKFNTYFYKKT